MKKYIVALIILTSLNTMAKEYYKFPKPSEPHGKVELGFGDYNKSIEPIYLYEIDGINVGKRTTNVMLSVGKHTLKCKTSFDLNDLDFRMDKGAKFKNTDKNNTTVVEIEDKKTYYLGFDTDGGNPDKWKCVIYKVEG